MNRVSPILVLMFLSLQFRQISCQDTGAGDHLFSITEGLSGTVINTVYQDSIGFLWIGTENGLAKYDGYSLLWFRNQPFDTGSLADNDIRTIGEDRSGDLWVATDKGISRLDRKTGSFVNYLPGDSAGKSLFEIPVYGLFADTTGIIWLNTGKDIAGLDTRAGVCTHFPLNKGTTGEKPPQGIIHMPVIPGRNGYLWCGSANGLFSFNTANKSSHFYPGPAVNSLCRDRQGLLWIGTIKGLYCCITDSMPDDPFSYPVIQFPKYQPCMVHQDYYGNIFITAQERCYKYFPEKMEYRSISAMEPFNIRNRMFMVNAMVADRSGILWLATSQGLLRINNNDSGFRLISRRQEKMYDLPADNITAIFADSNRFWIGTAGKGLAMIERKDDRITVYDTRNVENRKIPGNYVYDITRDRFGNLWTGTSGGASIFDERTGTFTDICKHYQGIDCSFLKSMSIYRIRPDASDNCWLATDRGLFRYDPGNNTLFTIDKVIAGQDTFSVDRVLALLEDHGGMIWFGTADGLVRYDPRQDRFNVFRFATGSRKTDMPGVIYCLCQDSRGDIWMGTSAGLVRFDRERNAFTTYTRDDGLAGNQVFSVLEDSHSDLWIGSDMGLTRFERARLLFNNFGTGEAIRENSFNPGAVTRDADGVCYFGGVAGVSVFHPDSVTSNPFVPNIAFTSFELNSENGKLITPLEKAYKIIVPRGNRLFIIYFSALDFTMPEKNRYMYQMIRNGHEGSWIDIGNQHFVTFFNLSSGSYSFTVRGSNNDQVWNKKGSTLEVIVPTPWWGSMGAFLLYGFLALLLVYLVVQFQTRNLRRSNRILQEKEMHAKEVARQREELMIKNKNITDSINYARRIQFALLPTVQQFSSILPESFILYKPKDIVSGDFYWITENPRKIYVAAIDCTGHGVPGAFMSIIGYELFRNITGVQGEPNPARILDNLNDNYVDIFSDGEHVYLKDGMDVAMCVFDKEENSLEFSGACNPLYLIRDETIIEIKADRSSIGADIIQVPTENRKFRSHKLLLRGNDILYLFSDGYADQFGGPEGKKFKYRRFRHLLLTIHQLPMHTQRSILEASIEEWRRGMDQVDDILVIGIRPVFGKKRS